MKTVNRLEFSGVFDFEADPDFTESGRHFFSGETIGAYLGYSTPRWSVNRVVSRNPWIRRLSIVRAIPTSDGKERDVRLYSTNGVIAITLVSGQQKAGETLTNAVFKWSTIEATTTPNRSIFA